MSDKPLLSVIAPMYNTEKYIKRFITCIRKQTYKNWELILVDDGSTDATIQVVESYCKEDIRIVLKIRDREPKCADTCRNIGQSMAKGKYMIIFDSDDIIEPYCFEQRVEYMEKHPEIEYATFAGESIISVTEGRDGEIIHTGKMWGIYTEKDILKSFLEADYPYAVWNNIYKTEIFKDQQWDEKIKVYQDFDYIIETLLNNHKHAFAEMSKIDYYYCVGHSNAITSEFISNEKYQSTLYLFEKTIQKLRNNNVGEEYIKSFMKFFLLQYERIVFAGNKEQLSNFVEFYSRYYERKLFRMKLFNIFFSETYNLQYKKIVLYIIVFPERIMKKILSFR